MLSLSDLLGQQTSFLFFHSIALQKCLTEHWSFMLKVIINLLVTGHKQDRVL